jgi:uncharacterized protein (DUF58 family)
MSRFTVLPSTRLLKLICVAFVVALVAAMVPALSGVWIACLVLVLVAAVADLFFGAPAKVEIEREPSARLVVGRWQQFDLRIIHVAGGPTHLSFYDVWPAEFEGEPETLPFSMAEGQSHVLEFAMKPCTHGKFTLGPIYLRQWPGLGLWERRSCLEVETKLRVFPEFSPGKSALERLQQLGEIGQRKSRQRGEGTEFESLRIYQQGDDSNHIDWKATARSGRVVSRQYTIEKDHDIMILLDCGRLMGARFEGTPKLDYAIRSALALTEAGLRLGDRVGLMTFDSKVRSYLAPGHGHGQMAAMLERVSEIKGTTHETSFESAVAHLAAHQRKRSLIVILTDFVDRYTAAPMMLGLSELARRHAFLFVAVEDPTIEEVLSRLPDSRKELAGQAVAYDLRRERKVVLEQLRRQGMAVLDLLPDQLTAPMLNQYVDLRNRGAI